MALRFSAWPWGAVEKYRAIAADLVQHDGALTREVQRTLRHLASASELSGFTDEDVAVFVSHVTAEFSAPDADQTGNGDEHSVVRINDIVVPKEVVIERRIDQPIVTVVDRVVEVPVEHVVPRIVEVPVEKVVELRVEKATEKVVERIIEVPVERIVYTTLEVPVEKIVERVIEVPNIVEKVIEKPVDHIVERMIEVPNIVDEAPSPLADPIPEAEAGPSRVQVETRGLDLDGAADRNASGPAASGRADQNREQPAKVECTISQFDLELPNDVYDRLTGGEIRFRVHGYRWRGSGDIYKIRNAPHSSSRREQIVRVILHQPVTIVDSTRFTVHQGSLVFNCLVEPDGPTSI